MSAVIISGTYLLWVPVQGGNSAGRGLHACYNIPFYLRPSRIGTVPGVQVFTVGCTVELRARRIAK